MNCAICFEDYNRNTNSTLSCKHSFHTSCIGEWLKTSPTCPCCRHILAPLEAWYASKQSIIPKPINTTNNTISLPSPPQIRRVRVESADEQEESTIWRSLLNVVMRTNT